MNRQAEFILTIIGAAFSILSTIFIVLYALFLGWGFTASMGYTSSEDVIFFGVFAVIIGIIVLVTIASAVIGFIAAFKIKADVPKIRTYAILLIVFGGLQISSIQGILFLIAGILTLTRKPAEKIESGEQTKWE